MKELKDLHDNLVSPREFVKRFNNIEELKDLLRKGIINDSAESLKIFERAEMYDYCKAAQDVIDEKVDKMLEGFGFSINDEE